MLRNVMAVIMAALTVVAIFIMALSSQSGCNNDTNNFCACDRCEM